jgi:AcrR family transcriptional regulator
MRRSKNNMTTASRRVREKESLKRLILDTARDMFVEHGYYGVTLRKIAHAIDYAPGTIYRYFKDKDELIRALCIADFDAFEQSFPRETAPADPLAAIRAAGAAYIRFALTHPNQYRLMFMTPRPAALHEFDDETLAKKGDPARDSYAMVRQLAQAAIDGGLLRADLQDPDLVAQTLWAGVHGMASLEITMGNDPWLDWGPVQTRIELMLDTLMRGLAREVSK